MAISTGAHNGIGRNNKHFWEAIAKKDTVQNEGCQGIPEGFRLSAGT